MSSIKHDPKRKKLVINVNGKWFPPADPNDPNDADLLAEETAQTETEQREEAYKRAKRAIQNMWCS